jgi:hypothetical protein
MSPSVPHVSTKAQIKTRHQNQGHLVKNREQALPNIPLHICQQLNLSIPSMLSDSVPILKTRSLAAANPASGVTISSFPCYWVQYIFSRHGLLQLPTLTLK